MEPRATVLKNTNVEAEIRGRQHGRRVHYSLEEDDDIEYSDYRQTISLNVMAYTFWFIEISHQAQMLRKLIIILE